MLKNTYSVPEALSFISHFPAKSQEVGITTSMLEMCKQEGGETRPVTEHRGGSTSSSQEVRASPQLCRSGSTWLAEQVGSSGPPGPARSRKIGGEAMGCGPWWRTTVSGFRLALLNMHPIETERLSRGGVAGGEVKVESEGILLA